MSDLATTASNPSPAVRLTDLGGGSPLTRLSAFAAQPAVRKALPYFVGVAALGGAALTWQTLAPVPQRVLYTQIDDSERANIVAALDKGSVHYHIDNNTGAMTVDESDLYKARMLVAENGSLAVPDTNSDGLDKLPMGASRSLEDERLRAAKEHELMLTVKEIDGVQDVRIHLAESEKSVFVRDNIPPSASVMLRLADGRQLSDSQVTAIVNLVAGSVPGLTPDAVKVVDQHGHLLSDKSQGGGNGDSDRLELQSRMEDKLQSQVSQLLTPILGDGNFTTETQVDLDMDQTTAARESYDKQGALRTETQEQSQTSPTATASGVPGMTSNSPPPAATASPGAPKGTPTPAATPSPSASPSPAAAPGGESTSSRTYELGREVSVSNENPGKIKRLSVAVALSAKAMAKFHQTDIDQIKQLVSAAVGADPARGDQVAVVVRGFDIVAPPVNTPFYEASWFATVLHNSVALIGLLLVLLLGVRPLIKVLKQDRTVNDDENYDQDSGPQPRLRAGLSGQGTSAAPAMTAELLGQHVGLAQQIVKDKPDSAVIALRAMLQPPSGEAA